MNTDNFSLQGHVACVTGSGGDLGRTFCIGLATAGAKVVCSDINEEAVAKTVSAVIEVGGEAVSFIGNVTDEADNANMVATALNTWGQLDILVNNAAIYATLDSMPFYEMSAELWDKVMAVNIKGPMLCSRAAYSALKDSGNGRIINIFSASVYTGAPNWSHYVTSKAGIIGLTRTMAREVGKDHITVNAIAPHMIVTSGTKSAVADHVQENAGSWGAIQGDLLPADIVGLLVYLASDAAR